MEFNKLSYPENWEKFTLSQVCTRITSGGTPSRKNEGFYKNGTIYWVKTKELENGYILDTEEKITELGLSTSSAKLLPKNTILLAMYGATVGELGILGKEMACNQACCALIVDHSRFDYRYLFYILKLHKEEFKQLATGAAQQNLSATTIKEFTFGFPELEKQKQIANILEALDDKIHLNTQTAQTLETIAQTIFKSWFVDFDPIHAKINAIENGEDPTLAAMQAISCKNPEELHRLQTENPQGYRELEKLANAFPCEIGEDGVPVGWEKTTITDKRVLEIIKPKIHKFEGEKDYIATANVSKNNIVGVLEKITYDARPSRANMQPIVDSIWFAKMVGEHKAIMIDKNDEFLLQRTILSTGFLGINPKKYKKCFLYCFINSDLFTQAKNMLATGAVQIALNNGSFSKIEIVLPDDKVLSIFETKMSEIFSSISLKQRENVHLSKIRDELLPKLLKGEI